MYFSFISVSPFDLYPQKKTIIGSNVGAQIHLNFTIRANPRPSLINCTLLDLEKKLQTVYVWQFSEARLPENFVSLGKDDYKFTLIVEMTGTEAFGEYMCSIINGIGDMISIGYTIQQNGNFSTLSYNNENCWYKHAFWNL